MNLPAAPDGQDRLDHIAEEVAERMRRGERPTLEEYLARHPDLAADLRQVFPALLVMERVGSSGGAGELAALEETPPLGIRDRAFGDYRILGVLGRGGMGIVYEAEQVSLGRRVALKILPWSARLDPQQLRRFQTEARAAASLSHPHIVPVHEVGERDGVHFYAMQFIPGRGLDAVIEELRELRGSGTVPGVAGTAGAPISVLAGPDPVSSEGSSRYIKSVVRIGIEVALALAYAHQESVLHRDIKPSNLLLDLQGKVWVADFGLAKTTGGEALTTPGDIVGTLRYMGPERFQGWSDPRSDVYSLGATLYELLTLEPPFRGKDRADLVRRILHEPLVRPRRLDPRIPRDLETIVLKAMEKDPQRRYAGAGQLAADLRLFLESRPIVARRVPAWERTWLWCRRNKLLSSLAAAVALLLLVVAIGASVAYIRLSQSAATEKESLWRSNVDEARARRSSRRPGQRYASLEALRKAAAHRSTQEVVNEALAALSLTEPKPEVSWPSPPDAVVATFDRAMESYAHADGDGRVTFHRLRGDPPHLEGEARLPGDCGPGAPALRFSPDGRLLTAWNDTRLVLWDLEGRSILGGLALPNSHHSVDFSPDVRLLGITREKQGPLFLELPSLREVKLPVGPQPATLLHFLPDGKTLAGTDFSQREIVFADLTGGGIRRSVTSPTPIQSLAFPEGFLAAAGCRDGTVYLFGVDEREPVAALKGHDNWVTSLLPAAIGPFLVSTGWDGMTCLWDVKAQRLLTRLEAIALGLRSDGRLVGTATTGKAELLRVQAEGEFRSVAVGGRRPGSQVLEFSPDGRWLISAGVDGVRIWNPGLAAEVARLPIGSTRDVRHLPDGSFVTAGDRGLFRWPVSVESGPPALRRVGPPLRLGPHTGVVSVSASRDGSILVYCLPGQACLLPRGVAGPRLDLEPYPFLNCTTLDPQGLWIAGGNWNGNGVRVWRTGEAKTATLLPGRGSTLALFSPDGSRLVVGDGDSYRAHETGTWNVLYRVPREGANSNGLMAFRQDGRVMAVVRTLKSILLVDTASGTEIASLETPEEAQVSWLCFRPDGRVLAAATFSDLRIHFWDLEALGRGLDGLGIRWKMPPVLGPPAGEGDAAGAATLTVDLGELEPGRSHRDELQAWDRIIKERPLDADARFRRGSFHEGSRSWALAEEDFTAAIEATGGTVEPWTRLLARARCRERLGKLAEAIEDCSKALELKPEFMDALVLRSYFRRAVGDHAGSIADGERRLASQPGSSEAINDLAWILAMAPLELRDLERAEALSRDSMAREPGSGGSWNTLGLILYRRGDLPAARAALEKALPRPGGGTAFDFYLLSAIHDRQGRRDLAREYRSMAAAWEGKASGLHLDQLQDLAALCREAEEASR